MRLKGPVDLPAVLQGGQAFRWRRTPTGSYVGAVGERLVEFKPGRAGSVIARAAPRARASLLAHYLGLGADADARRERVGRDPVLAAAVRDRPGLRVLRQDPWETTVAFITSANNNVLRIEGILTRLADAYGAPLTDGEHEARAFPPPDVVARVSETQLRALGLGYRAPFLRDAARMVALGDVDLHALRGASWPEAREALLALPGVGPKVADCIALFSLDVTGAFPVDRWVLRAVVEAFPTEFGTLTAEPKPRAIEAFAQARWGDAAGLAQQYLFHMARVRQNAPGTQRLQAEGAHRRVQG